MPDCNSALTEAPNARALPASSFLRQLGDCGGCGCKSSLFRKSPLIGISFASHQINWTIGVLLSPWIKGYMDHYSRCVCAGDEQDKCEEFPYTEFRMPKFAPCEREFTHSPALP
jgi:hypothetical protein